LKLIVLLEIIYLCILSPKNLKTICKFVEIDHAEAWKILARILSGFLQELKATTLTKYFRSINLAFNSAALILQRNEDKITPNIAAINSTEVKTTRK